MERKEVLFSDLAKQLTPQTAINPDHFAPYQWRAVPYECAQVRGTMVAAVGHSNVPALTLAPELTGWYKIYLGTLKMPYGPLTEIHVKLTNDPVFTSVRPDSLLPRNHMDEALWKCADMTGQTISFRQPHWDYEYHSSLALVRFVPMSDEEVAAYQADQARTDTKRLYATDDIHNIFGNNPRSLDDFLAQVEQYRDSDVKVLSMECLNFFDFTRPDRVDQERYFARAHERQYTSATRWLLDNDIDIYKAMIDHGHSMGLDMYLSMRMGFWSAAFPNELGFYCQYFEEHPELRMKDRDGVTISRLSYAYPESRKFIIDLLCDMAKYDCDGIDLLYNRGYPFSLFEQPVLDMVQERYGVDARVLPNTDERILAVRAEIMNTFMRELRQRVDQERAERGQKPIRIAAHVHKNLRGNTFMGLDLKTWIKEGLINDIECYPLEQHDELPDEVFTDDSRTLIDLEQYTAALDNAPANCHQVWYDTSDNCIDETTELAALVKGSDVKLYVDIMPRNMEPEEFRQRALRLYECGIEGISLWDTYDRAKFKREWTMLRRLGHKEELPGFTDGAGELFRVHRILKIGQHRIDRYSPNWGG